MLFLECNWCGTFHHLTHWYSMWHAKLTGFCGSSRADPKQTCDFMKSKRNRIIKKIGSRKTKKKWSKTWTLLYRYRLLGFLDGYSSFVFQFSLTERTVFRILVSKNDRKKILRLQDPHSRVNLIFLNQLTMQDVGDFLWSRVLFIASLCQVLGFAGSFCFW